MSPAYLVTAAEMRAIEAEEATRGKTSEVLMERAGRSVADDVIRRAGADGPHKVLVLAGPGNNGGDGLVVARLLAQEGFQVRCLTWSRTTQGDDRLQAPLRSLSVPIEPASVATLEAALGWCTIVVDGLLGTGIKRDVEGELARIVRRVATSGRKTIAVDIPTGVDSDTGAVRGIALPCRYTVALGLLKYGHILQPGATLSGEITLGDIGISEQTGARIASGQLLDTAAVRALLPDRPADSNKGTFGKAMIVAGSVNYLGAPVLATQGALRSGAGLVTLACAGDLLGLMAPRLTESTFLPLPSDLGAISGRAVDKLREALEGYAALLIGCGLGKDKETAAFIKGLFASKAEAESDRHIGFAARAVEHAPEQESARQELPPLVLDGDALNFLSEIDGWHTLVPENSVLTPHPGEMARLLGRTVEEVQSDRVTVARNAAADWKQIVVLKGAATLIAEPSGKIYTSPFSNPALATAGTGDVLAGTIVGLLAQGLTPVNAACAGVYLHGLAGELLREEYGPAGGLAGDLPVLLARAQKQVRGNA
ncbi:MAG: NAD(P)H-hydrate dehydratase [Chloroflexia bacterium]